MSKPNQPRRRESDRSWFDKFWGRRPSDPLERLRRALCELSAGEASQALQFRAGDDCGQVATEFNALAEHVERLGRERDRALEQASRQSGKSWMYAQPTSNVPADDEAAAASSDLVTLGPSTF